MGLTEGEPSRERMIGRGKKAFVFPGQGSQAIGMGLELYEYSKAAREVFDDADMALGFKLSKMIFEGPVNELEDTINSQPAIMIVSMASLKALQENLKDKMPQPFLMAGHSLGQYTSAVAAGAISFSDGVRLVRERGRLMQEAAEKVPGTMAAIIGKLDASVLEGVCAETGVVLGNINSDEQIVISGSKEAVELAIKLASERGARKTVPLSVSGAFHSDLMSSAKQGLGEAISNISFNKPQVPIVANSSGELLLTADDIREELIDGLCKCVLWRDSIQNMVGLGVTNFIELGSGRVLSGLVKRIDNSAHTFNIDSPKSIQKLAMDLTL